MNSDPITVLAVGGTAESYRGDDRRAVQGMLAGVTDRLSDRFTARWVGYPADYGPVTGFHHDAFALSVPEGSRNLAARIACCEGPVALLGYSQGCCVIRSLLEDADTTLISRIAGVGFVADPLMPAGAAFGKPDLRGWGVAGAGRELAVPAWWVANDHDPIPLASPDSLLRDLADITEFMSFTDVVLWGRKLAQRISENTWQMPWTGELPGEPWDAGIARRRVD
ncbi:MAG: PE-PPE domain-containing protein, partial [Nocardia sp.]|nr:PE-PPE domain-containing protein [Nocardia sp.]